MRKEFEEYVERMVKIRRLSTPSLETISNENDYSRILLENFRQIGLMAGENRETIDEILLPMLKQDKPLSDTDIEELSALNALLLDERECYEIDQHVADLIGEKLADESDPMDAENHEEDTLTRIHRLGRKLQIKYFRMITCEHSNPEASERIRQEGLDTLERLEVYQSPEAMAKLPMDERIFVFRSIANGCLLYQTYLGGNHAKYRKEMMKALKHSIQYMNDPVYRELLCELDWLTFEFQIYDHMGTLVDDPEMSVEEARELFSYMLQFETLWDSEQEHFLKKYPDYSTSFVKEQVFRAAVLAEDSSSKERFKELYDLYLQRDERDYSWQGGHMNIDLPLSLYQALISRQMSKGILTERDYHTLSYLTRGILEYMQKMPKEGMLIDRVIMYNKFLGVYREFPGSMKFGEFCIQSLAAIHPPTYIHSNMVAKLSCCLTRHLLNKKPEIFCTFPGTGDIAGVFEKKEEIANYAYYAALYHDIGKLTIIDTIAMYGRKLLDSEYFNLKCHPDNGAKMAGLHESTRPYVDVIRGHHRWYDMSRGYPNDFDTFSSPYKAIIDIVTVADCLDAATDSVGRSYNRGKTFVDFEREVAETAGTRYAPYFADLLRDAAIREDIEFLLKEGRSSLYKETFHLLKNIIL